MGISILENQNYLEERKLQYLMEMNEKKIIAEVNKLRESLQEILILVKAVRKEINYLKNNPQEKKQSENDISPSKEELNEREIGVEKSSNNSSQSGQSGRPHPSDFKKGEISIEKFFNFGRK